MALKTGGIIDIAFIGAQFYPKFLDEKCPVIAQTVATREDGWEDVPTIKELGYDFEFDVRMFISAPANLPDGIRKAIGDATEKMFETGQFPEILIKAGEKPKHQGYDDLNAYLETYYPRTLQMMRDFKNTRK